MPARRLERERLEDRPRCRADGVVLGVHSRGRAGIRDQAGLGQALDPAATQPQLSPGSDLRGRAFLGVWLRAMSPGISSSPCAMFELVHVNDPALDALLGPVRVGIRAFIGAAAAQWQVRAMTRRLCWTGSV